MCITETRTIARRLESFGYDAIHVSVGNYKANGYGASCQITGSPQGIITNLASQVKSAVKIPVITVNRILEPYMAEELIEDGHADIIAFGRTSLADPHYPEKVREGRLDDIWSCIGCHQSCLDPMFAHKTISCSVNPFTGHENSRKIVPAAKVKKIVVVGAGPAGLLCAALLAQRGHKVDLYEKSEVLGGNFRIAAFPPLKSELSKVIRFYSVYARKHGVKIHMGTEVTPALLKEIAPDAVVLATGGIPLVPPIEGINDTGILVAHDVLAGKVMAPGEKVLVAGGGMIGAETADYLGNYGKQVTIVEMRPGIALDVPGSNGRMLRLRLDGYNTEYLTGATIKKFVPGGVVYEKDGQEHRLDGFDSVVLAMGSASCNPLEKDARDLVPEVFVIGDAEKVGKLNDATNSAAEVGLSL